MSLAFRIVTLAWALFALVSPLAAADTAAPAQSTVPAPQVLANFTSPISDVFGYGSWQGHFGPTSKAGYLVIGSKGAMGDGGFGHNLESAVDMTKTPIVEIALAVQPGNEVPNYTIVFEDEDGTPSSARLFVKQIMPGQPVWLRVGLEDFSQGKGQGEDNGKMDWTKVTRWHLQGDWATKKPASVLFIAIRVRGS